MPRRSTPAARVALVGLVALLLSCLVALVVVARDAARTAGEPVPAPASPAPSSPGPGTQAPDPGSTQPGGTVSPCARGGGPLPRLTVLSLNIHGAVGRGGYDLEQVASEIEAWDADVVLLQEVHRFRKASGLDDQPVALEQLTGMRAYFGENFSERPEAVGYPRRQSGTAVLTDLPVLGEHNTLLPNRPGKQQRGLLRVTVRLDGRAVDVYGTHLEHTRGTIRFAQARDIRRIVERREAAQPRPFVLGGDLNTEPDTRPMRVVRSFATDPWPQVGVGVGETVLPREPRRRIDYVVHGPGWRAVTARTLLSQVADHRGLRTTLALDPSC